MNSDVVFKRKFRWTISGELPEGKLEEAFCKVAARPNLKIEEIEFSVPNARWWVPGKQEWEQITVTFYELDGKKLEDLWKFVSTHQDGQKPEKCATFKLNLYDGCGTLMEGWTLFNAHMTAINFGELDHSSSEQTTVELTIRYESVKYEPYCGPNAVTPPAGKSTRPMGLGMLGRKVTCPQCKHEFNDCTNIVF